MRTPRLSVGPIIVFVGITTVLLAHPVLADPWYEHYDNAEQALDDQDWALAVGEINEALARKGDSGVRVRSYGMNVTSYFPYFKLGVAYYHLGQFDAALQAFETEARLGAIEQSEQESAELARYRTLVQEARATAAAEALERIREIVAQNLDDARDLQSRGLLDEAMTALDRALAVAPDDAEAQSAMHQLRLQLAERERKQIQELLDNTQESLQSQQETPDADDDTPATVEAMLEGVRRETISGLLADAESYFDSGLAEQALSAANRVLALEPGNNAALAHVARAYGIISRELLGTATRGNIPPAVRFVDLREPAGDGALVQTVSAPDFRLNGVVIDDSPVAVIFFGADGEELVTRLDSQPIGEFFLTEFSVESSIAPGLSTFRLVATDEGNLSSSSEYAVMYIRPTHLAPWFYVLLLGSAFALGSLLLWRRSQQREQLRRRRFNPYVAGAPIFEQDMFFGRHKLVDRILQTIHNNSLLIYGERRIGKTSIQHQIKKRLQSLNDPDYEFHPVYIDLQGTPETLFFRTISEDIFQELAPVLNGLEPGKDFSGDYSYREFVHDVRAVLKVLRKRTPKRVKLVLLIDEVDELNDYDPRINQKLRSLFMKSFAENLVAVVSGVEIKKQWEREGSPWYNFFEEIEVEPLDQRAARDLIERPIRGMFKLDDGTTDRIISLTGCKPYLIQKFCIALVTRLHEQNRRRITIADVEALHSLMHRTQNELRDP